MGVIYILTNPSFPQYVKIGYADDVNKRLNELNRSECIPFAFKLYAYYEVSVRLTDLKLHDMIDRLNPNLKYINDFSGKKGIRQFYIMDAHNAYSILETIAEINGLKDKLHLVEPLKEDLKNEDNEIIKNRKRSPNLPQMDWLIEQGIVHIGDEIFVINHPNEIAKIIDSKNVDYNGEIMSFTQFGCKITGWKAIRYYAWMKIKGQTSTLLELREKKMRELGIIE